MTEVPYFVSYAHADQAAADDFLRRLETDLRCSSQFRFQAWRDPLLLAGDDWKDEIQSAIARSRFGLLLVSRDFLASQFIATYELPPLLSPPPGSPCLRVVPVALKPIPFNGTMNLRGLEAKQFYGVGKPFSGCRSDAQRDQFARGLFDQLHKMKW